MTARRRVAKVLRRVARRLDPPAKRPRPEPAVTSVPEPEPAVVAVPVPEPPPAGPPRKWIRKSPPGSRAASMFFDQYPRFYETSQTTATRGRLNLRYEAIFAQNSDIMAGAKVLDIASHDGRWSLAALACGAESVIGIEARPELVENAVATLAEYGWGPDRASFITGDVFDIFRKQTFDVDVVLCLGFLYHTLRYPELMHGIRAANPRHLIIDTAAPAMMADKPLVAIQRDFVERQRAAARDDYTHGDTALVGQPNLQAISVIARSYDFKIERLSDWDGLLRDNPDLVALGDVVDYTRYGRTTIRCVDRTPHAAEADTEAEAETDTGADAETSTETDTETSTETEDEPGVASTVVTP